MARQPHRIGIAILHDAALCGPEQRGERIAHENGRRLVEKCRNGGTGHDRTGGFQVVSDNQCRLHHRAASLLYARTLPDVPAAHRRQRPVIACAAGRSKKRAMTLSSAAPHPQSQCARLRLLRRPRGIRRRQARRRRGHPAGARSPGGGTRSFTGCERAAHLVPVTPRAKPDCRTAVASWPLQD